MKIVSWNILAAEWIKKSYYPNVKEKVLFDRKNRLKIIMERIINEDPDILLLQEVMKLEYKTFIKHFHDKFHISILSPIDWSNDASKEPKKSDNITSESGNVTLLKKSVFKSKKDIFEQSLEMNFGIYTTALYASKRIHIFNIHLNDLHGQTRNKQINMLRPFIEKQHYCIIGGDFNQEYRLNSKLYTISGFNVNNKCPTYYVKKNMNIDNILSKGFALEKEQTNENICHYIPLNLENGFKIYGSDHLPVILLLKV